jgi:hypothetical protein
MIPLEGFEVLARLLGNPEPVEVINLEVLRARDRRIIARRVGPDRVEAIERIHIEGLRRRWEHHQHAPWVLSQEADSPASVAAAAWSWRTKRQRVRTERGVWEMLAKDAIRSLETRHGSQAKDDLLDRLMGCPSEAVSPVEDALLWTLLAEIEEGTWLMMAITASGIRISG